MKSELINFIKENKDLINENSKDSWEKIYSFLEDCEFNGEFTQIILDAGINDPASILGYIPEDYLYKSNITNYKIPDSITSIGSYAFYNCDSLTSIVIPNGVTRIGFSAFSNCSSLTSVVIPDSVTSIRDYAFSNCSSLTSVEIGDSVTSIGECAFYNCCSLTEIIVPSSVASIDNLAFKQCNNLERVEIKSTSLTTIGENIFENCPKLKSIYYDGSMKPELVKLKGKRKNLKIICTDGIM